jgi:hypothetical protein
LLQNLKDFSLELYGWSQEHDGWWRAHDGWLIRIRRVC